MSEEPAGIGAVIKPRREPLIAANICQEQMRPQEVSPETNRARSPD